MWRLTGLSATVMLVFCSLVSAQVHNVWEVPRKQGTVTVDGSLQEWSAIPGLTIQLGAPGVVTQSVTQADDTKAVLKAVWDAESLFVAVEWKDNTWDVEQVLRQQAIWVTPEQQRRERMLFFDYLKFNIHDIRYDYLLWVTPRIEGRGPFSWDRFLEGAKRMERASSPPAISGRQAGGTATLEIMFKWRELKAEPKDGAGFPLSLVLTDADSPGQPLELKVKQLKSLQWDGIMRLTR